MNNIMGICQVVARAAEKLAQRSAAVQAAQTRRPVGPAHPTPMVRHGAPHVPPRANGNAPALTRTAAEAAAAMCRVCNWRPKGDVVPSWQLVEAAAEATCDECQRRVGVPATPDVCRNCPGVAMLAALVGVKVKTPLG